MTKNAISTLVDSPVLAQMEAYGLIQDVLQRIINQRNGAMWFERLKSLLHPCTTIRRGMFELSVTRDLRVAVQPDSTDKPIEIAFPTYVFHIRSETAPSIKAVYDALDPDDTQVGITYRTLDRVQMEAHMSQVWEHTPSWTEGGTTILFFLPNGAHEYVYDARKKRWDNFSVRPEDMADRFVPGDEKTQIVLPRDIR